MDQSPAADARRLAHKKQELILAVRADDRDTIVSLLDEEIPINTRNNEGESLLHGAAQDGHVTTMRLLIRRGCKVDLVDARGLTPLHSAAAQGQTKAVRELIRNGASKSEVASIFGTPLHQAASKGHIETVVAMLEEGCPLDVVNSAGSTVLHWAAEGGHVEVVRELVGRGCDVNAVRADGCTPLHCAAAHGRTEAVRELIKLGATKSIDATMFGTPIDQARLIGHAETVEALLVDEVHHLELTKCATSLNRVLSECNTIGTSASFGVTPVMSALLFGKVEMFKLLISKGGKISDRDIYSLSTFEHCFIGGQASKLSEFCQACGIGSGREGLRHALATLINQGLVDASKVLCLCAFSGDSIFLGDEFVELVASDDCAMSAALQCAQFYFFNGLPFLNQLRIPDTRCSLTPLHMALLSYKCCEMGFATLSVESGAKDHTSFITSLLSHPVLKKTVNENFPNGLSPLDIAQKFELHHIAALIAWAGGRPGVWANVPPNIEYKHPLAMSQVKEAYAFMKAIAEDGESGVEFMKVVFFSILRLQKAESEANTDILQDGLWHSNAVIVGADVGPETDEHEYKSLMVPADKSKNPPTMRSCKHASEVIKKVVDHSKEINAMLNHHTEGTVHFGIDKKNTVEEGLDLSQAAVIDQLQTRVGQLLKDFYPAVQYSRFVRIHPVQLQNSIGGLTGRWRFDICVKPHNEVVLFGRNHTVAYYRQGGSSEQMTADMLMEKRQAESVLGLNPMWLCMMLVLACFASIILLFIT